MNPEENKIINAEPAAFPATSTAELENKNVLEHLLGMKYMRGEIRAMDKYPNSDGILEIIDDRRIHVGYIDVQLKTLAIQDYASPKYQCELEFLSYCEKALLPVILFVVNRNDKKAYWRHIDRSTLLEVAPKIKGATISVPIAIENCIDGSNDNHFTEWTAIINDLRKRNWQYEQSIERQKILESEISKIIEKTDNPINLPLPAVKDLHGFLDQYNYILDIEFPTIKNILYPNFWKIGLGIVSYDFTGYYFILYPVEYKKNQTLIKYVEITPQTDFSRDMFEGSVLLTAMGKSIEKIRDYPKQFAYDLLDDSILKAVKENNLPIPDEFIAHEYLVNFIDKNCVYLDLEKDAQQYDLNDLKYRLQKLLPMHSTLDKTYADWVRESKDSVESYQNYRPGGYHKDSLAEAQKKIDEGFEPQVKVTIISLEFNIDLIYFYIDYLQELRISSAKRQYLTRMRNIDMYGVELWKTWNKDVLWKNFQTVVDNFQRCYDLYVSVHFPKLKEVLKISETEGISKAYLLRFDDEKKYQPNIEVYSLWPAKPDHPITYFFVDPDDNIDRRKYWIDRELECTIHGKYYSYTEVQGFGFDFMFEISPIYAYIKMEITRKLKKYFSDNLKT